MEMFRYQFFLLYTILPSFHTCTTHSMFRYGYMCECKQMNFQPGFFWTFSLSARLFEKGEGMCGYDMFAIIGLAWNIKECKVEPWGATLQTGK